MQDFKVSIVKSLLFIICIPPLSIGFLSYRPHRIYECIRVIDGDTVDLERNGIKLRVRLAYIDAPELVQFSFDRKAIGAQSKQYLKQLVEGKMLRLKLLRFDMYGRALGEVFLSEKSVNLKLVKSGYAVPYYQNPGFRFKQAKYIAKSRRLGIWKYDGFVSPWNFRKKAENKKTRKFRAFYL
jgi:micrococcal nuclease